MSRYDVAISGLGPTGATLAALLAECNLKVLILDREAAAYHLPRAVHFDAEVMRVFQWIGIADELEPLTALHPGMRFVDSDDKILLDWPRPQGIGPQGWRSNYRFHQPDLERLLRQKLSTLPNVTVRTQCEVFDIINHDSHVSLRFENLVDGTFDTAAAKYFVGADGARSLARRFIESELEDWGFNERWLVIDLLLRREIPELGDVSIQYCDAERGGTYVRGPQNRRRWELRLLPNEDSQEIIRPENLWPLLSRWISEDDADLERAAVYTFNSRVANQWHKGRILLAGDACHQTPPFMGQGMCAGIRDAANLYWKLAKVCGGNATKGLLTSYQSERRPNAVEYITTAVRLGGLINRASTQEALRAAFPSDGKLQMVSIAPPLGEGMTAYGSKLIGQPHLLDGRRSDDLTKHRFVIFVQSRALLEGMNLPEELAVLSPEDAPDVLEYLNGKEFLLLRPDRYLLTDNTIMTIQAAVDLYILQ